MSEVDALAFSPHQVQRITGLSLHQLRYWDETGFFAPEFKAEEGEYGGFSRIYSFRDVVGLYTVARLRKEYGFSLQELRPIGEYLKKYHETPWASLAVYFSGKQFYFTNPEQPGDYIGLRPLAQTPLSSIKMERMARDVRARVQRMRQREPDQVGQIEKRRNVAHNSPVVAGTRVPTSAIWNLRQAGLGVDEIVKEYPRLTAADVDAAVQFEKAQERRRTRRRA